MTPPPTPDQSGQGGFHYDPYIGQSPQVPSPGGDSQPQPSGYGQPGQPPASGDQQPPAPGYGQQPPAPGYGPAPQLPPAPPAYPPPYGAPPPYDMPAYGLPQGQSIASMVLGIVAVVSLCCFGSIPYLDGSVPFLSKTVTLAFGVTATILGGVALKKVKRGEAGGKGMAVTGLVLGIVVCAIATIVIVLAIVLTAAFTGVSVTTVN